MSEQGAVVVVGSANLDLVAQVTQRPMKGETVLSHDYVEVVGGKGVNQALAAARGISTRWIGALGTDPAAEVILAELARYGVDSSDALRVPQPSGRALITVTPDGDNAIVVAPLANAELSASHVVERLQALSPAVVLAQFEVPMAVVAAASQWCVDHGRRFVLNPSPVIPVDASVLAASDPLVVNEHEARALTSRGDVLEAARALAMVSRSVVLTQGERGAVVFESGLEITVPAVQVEVVDTTGAGDAFVGTVAATLAQGETLVAAVRAGVVRASEVIARSRTAREREPVERRQLSFPCRGVEG